MKKTNTNKYKIYLKELREKYRNNSNYRLKICTQSLIYYHKMTQDKTWRLKENERIREYYKIQRENNPEWLQHNRLYFRDYMRDYLDIPIDKWRIVT